MAVIHNLISMPHVEAMSFINLTGYFYSLGKQFYIIDNTTSVENKPDKESTTAVILYLNAIPSLGIHMATRVCVISISSSPCGASVWSQIWTNVSRFLPARWCIKLNANVMITCSDVQQVMLAITSHANML